MKRQSAALIALALAAGCAGGGAPGAPDGIGTKQLEIDDVDVPPQGMSLVVMDGTSDVGAFADAVTKMQGAVVHAEGTRLLVARLPANADAVLRGLGMVARYDAAVDPADLGATTIEERRFVRVFDNRYYPAQTKAALALRTMRVARAAGDGLGEMAPQRAPVVRDGVAGPDRDTTPFASGTIVVSIWLPESNGVAEPSTEDWTEDAIVESYVKVQSALEAFTRTEPNANLRFVLHLESSPGHGGLPGTLDSDWEFGKHANFDDGAGEAMVSAPILARLLGHPVTTDTVWDAYYEYVNGLRDRYGADGAFFVKVTPDRNFTAGLRAHAMINGPWATLSTDYGFETFFHEFGHVMGALDEYCPDACSDPTSLQGYLGMTNANATFRPGGSGVNGGQGEDMPSLMQFNDPMAVGGYTRGAWGWIDSDGDGIVEVRDTTPTSALSAVASGQSAHLVGTITDVGATRAWGEPRSFNRIVGVDVRPSDRAGAPWVRVPVAAPTVRGTATVDLDVGTFPAGTTAIDARAVNSIGNVELAPKRIAIAATGARNTEPRVGLAATPEVGSTRSTFALAASGFDLDGDRVSYRFDVDGDGRFDTPFGTSKTATARFATPGVHAAIVEARDAHGATARAQVRLLVTDGNALPAVTLAPAPTPVFGDRAFDHDFAVASAVDPDGDALDFAWTAELATDDDVIKVGTGFAPSNTSFPVALAMPLTLRSTPVDLTGGAKLPKASLTKVVALSPTLMAAAAGRAGLLVTDVSTPTAPRLVAQLDLQTDADRMLLDGTRLYVTSPSLLAIVDVSNPAKPVEIAQRTPFTATRTVSETSPAPIDDGASDSWNGSHYLYESYGERIARVSVQIQIDHPAPGELRISLFDPERNEIVLRDHVPGPGGLQTYAFDAPTSSGLTQLAGRLASGPWTVRVVDDVPGNAGTLVASTLTFDTSSRAEPIGTDGLLLGVVGGRYPIVAGLAFEVHDAVDAKNVKLVASLPSTGAYGGGISGTTAIVLSPLAPKKGLVPAGKTATARGLYAVDLRNPRKPALVRVDTSYEGGSLFVVGSRFYLLTYGDGGRGGDGPAPTTSIGSVARFAAGATSYVMGTLPVALHEASGDDRTLVGLGERQGIARVDVSDPARARVLATYFRPTGSGLAPIDANRFALYDQGGAPFARLVDLRASDAITSRVFRVTLQARDAQGAVAVASRAIHAVPYDHAPTIDALSIEASSDSPDVAIALTASDPDRATWDPTLLARVDLDGDGVFDGDWTPLQAGQPATFTVPRASAGAARFEVRDGFLATTGAEVDMTGF